jgi:sulfite exporter TauE/SafE
VDPSEPLQGLVLLGTGVTMSVGHCVGMCGPILGAYAAAQRTGVPPFALYHAGRVTSYVILGTVFGALGSATNWFEATARAQATLSIVVGLLMAALALGLLGVLPTRAWIESAAIARRVVQRIRGLLGTRTSHGRFALGVTNGFLPCGPVMVVALAAATTGSALRGGISLLLYGLGTVPALLLLGLGAGRLGAATRTWIYRIGSLLVTLLAVQLVLRGLAAWGIVPHVHLGSVVLW